MRVENGAYSDEFLMMALILYFDDESRPSVSSQSPDPAEDEKCFIDKLMTVIDYR